MRAQALEDAGPAMNSQAIAIPQIDPVPRVSIQAFCETSEIATVNKIWAAPPRRWRPIEAHRRRT
jgi:hypothetical protein